MTTVWLAAAVAGFAGSLIFLILGITSITSRKSGQRRMAAKIENEHRGYITDNNYTS